MLSPRLIEDWKAMGMEFSRPDNAYSDPNFLLQSEKIAGAFLISMAHLYTTEAFGPIVESQGFERRLLAAENDYIAVCVATNPKRFFGFYSVNPLKEYAFDELTRCRANPNLTGLKLHLPACGVDLENTSHTTQLAKVLSWAADNDVPVLLHLSAGEEISLSRSLWFWETTVQPHSTLELYLAHLGSVGGYNTSSQNILHGYRRLAEERAEFRKMKIYFDLSGAIIGQGSEEGRHTTDEQCKNLSEQILRIGVERFLFASDYPVFSLSQTRDNLVQRLRLPEKEISRLLANRSCRFQTDQQQNADTPKRPDR
jgi:predicted TIM-barrel fold metal-dependent hydrolase